MRRKKRAPKKIVNIKSISDYQTEINALLDEIGARTGLLQNNLGMMIRNFKMLNVYSLTLSDILIKKKIFTREELNKLINANMDSMIKAEQGLMKQNEEEVTNDFLENIDEDEMASA